MALGSSLGFDVLNFDVGRCAMNSDHPIVSNFLIRGSYPMYDALATERLARIERLVIQRGMTATAAAIVVDAAMFGIGCLEGEVRAKIEAQKKETNEPDSQSSARSVEGEPDTSDSVLLHAD